MFNRFKAPLPDTLRISEDSLRQTTAAILTMMGCSPRDATTGADTLVATDLRGVESHGVSNQLRVYVRQYRAHELNPRPKVRTLMETASTAALDGDQGLGIILAPRCMKMAIKKAKQVGVGIVTLRNAGHIGAAGHHALLAANAGMVGLCACSTRPFVVPTFGAEPRLGTNPIAIAAPARSEPFLLFDVATSAIAGNKVVLSERIGAPLLPGWITRLDGTPVNEEALSPGQNQYWLLPLGGTPEQGSHKGYGLALMVEVLATVLGGAAPIMLGEPWVQHSFFAAINIAALTNLDDFKDTMDAMLLMLRTTRPAAGHSRVLYPGLPESEAEHDRKRNGIPLHREVVQWFDGLTAELGLPRLKRRRKREAIARPDDAGRKRRPG